MQERESRNELRAPSNIGCQYRDHQLVAARGADPMVQNEDDKSLPAFCGQGWAEDKSGNWRIIVYAEIGHEYEKAKEGNGLIYTAAFKRSTQDREIAWRWSTAKSARRIWLTPLQLTRQYENVDSAKFLTLRGAEVESKPNGWVIKSFSRCAGMTINWNM